MSHICGENCCVKVEVMTRFVSFVCLKSGMSVFCFLLGFFPEQPDRLGGFRGLDDYSSGSSDIRSHCL